MLKAGDKVSEEENEIRLTFKKRRETKRTYLFDEQLGEQGWSDKDVAVGALYIQKQALELIGSPDEIVVVITPKGG